MGFTRSRPRKGQSKKLSPCAVRQLQKLASKNRRMSAASIVLEVAEVKGQLVSAQTIRHTLQQVSLHGCRPRRKPLLKLAHKKACKQFAEDYLAKSMNYWNHVLWSDESKVNLERFTTTSSASSFPTFSQQLYQEQACSAVSDAGQRARQEEERRAVESVKCLIGTHNGGRHLTYILMCARATSVEYVNTF